MSARLLQRKFEVSAGAREQERRGRRGKGKKEEKKKKGKGQVSEDFAPIRTAPSGEEGGRGKKEKKGKKNVTSLAFLNLAAFGSTRRKEGGKKGKRKGRGRERYLFNFL